MNQRTLVSTNPVRILLAVLLFTVLVQGVFAGPSCTFVSMWGWFEGGSSTSAQGVAVDPSGNVYVIDTDHKRIVKSLSDGLLISWWDLMDTESGKSVVPYGIAVGASGTMYITDRENSTVHTFTSSGSQGQVWGSEGTGDGQFFHPTGIAVDSSGNVYVADTGNNRIQKFHSTGKYLLQWGSYGTADGVFNGPTGVAVDANGLVYVADTGNKRIQKFNPSGTFLAKWGTAGTGNGQFSTPTGVATDSWGNVWVADLTPRVQEFSPTGEYFTTCDTGGLTGDVAIDRSGTMYALLQSGSLWQVGKYGIAGAVPAQTAVSAMATRQTNGVTITSGVPAGSQNPALPAHPPVTVPSVTPCTSPALTPAASDAPVASPGDQDAGDVRKTDIQKEIFDRISIIFRYVFGVEI